MERSAGAIVFRKNKIIKYLILYKRADKQFRAIWEFPKGNIENENEIQAVKRELKEETGIKDIEFVKNFKEKINYFYKKNNKLIHKQVIFYLVKTKQKQIKISREHNAYEWLSYEQALKKLTFNKELLKKANDCLRSIQN